MPLELRLLTGLALALGVVYSATPLAIRVADRLHFYDKPVGYKGHAKPTPYLGGAALMAGFIIALLAVSTSDFGRTAPLLGGMAVLWGVGTLDDRHNLAPGLRVAVEVVIAAMLWATGLGWDLGLGGAVDLVLTILWVVAVVNAFNLFDNMDGAASTMAAVVSAGVVLLGLIHHDTWLAVAAATLCGACLGFLPHNMVSPARIFLGDGGSMPLGFGVAALVMIGSAEAVPAWQALVVGLLLVGVPALDTALVMVSRRRRGVSILTGSRDHLTHRTQRRMRTARAVAMSLGAVQALISALALFAIRGGASAIVLIVVLYAVAVATAIALLEAAEGTEPAVAETASPALAAVVDRRTSVRARLANWPLISLVVLLGVTAGASPFRAGFYEPGTWVPYGLMLLGIAIAGAIARPPALSRPAVSRSGRSQGSRRGRSCPRPGRRRSSRLRSRATACSCSRPSWRRRSCWSGPTCWLPTSSADSSPASAPSPRMSSSISWAARPTRSSSAAGSTSRWATSTPPAPSSSWACGSATRSPDRGAHGSPAWEPAPPPSWPAARC